jgi:RNA polymerase sigma-70 factor (ECF subfamily)
LDKKTNIKQIVDNCVNGNPFAQKSLYDIYSAKMFSVCNRYMTNRTDAEDVFQDGFLKVFENISKLKNIEAIEWWMKKIFINEALQLYHKKKKIDFSSEESSFEVAQIDDFNIYVKLQTDEISKLLNELPEKMRITFNLYAIEGYSHKEIAEMLNVTEGTSKSNLHDARIILKDKIKKLI